MHPLKELKAYCKELATQIRTEKKDCKAQNQVICDEFQDDNGRQPSPYWNDLTSDRKKQYYDWYKMLWNAQGNLWNHRRIFRMHHIAYCELRGKTREQIEPRCRVRDNWTGTEYQGQYNCMNEEIEKIKTVWQEKINKYYADRLAYRRLTYDQCWASF